MRPPPIGQGAVITAQLRLFFADFTTMPCLAVAMVCVRSEPELVSCRCGALYERVWVSLPIKDIGAFDCVACGQRLELWHGRAVPTFRAIDRQDKLRLIN